MHAIMVQATPMDAEGDAYILECSECGPVTIVEGDEVKESCALHMTGHGAVGVRETNAE